MSEATKPKYDAIPLNPPPLPTPPSSVLFGSMPIAPEKPVTKKTTSPDPIPAINVAPSAPPAVGTPTVPDWLKSIFVPGRTHGVLAVAATSLFGGWYGVKSLFPPAMVGDQAKSNEPVKTVFEYSKPAGGETVEPVIVPLVVPPVPASTVLPLSPIMPTLPPSSGVAMHELPSPTVPQVPVYTVPPSPPSSGVIQTGYVEPGQLPIGIPSPTSPTTPTTVSFPAVTTVPTVPVSPPPAQLPSAITLPEVTAPGITPVGGTPPTPVIPSLPGLVPTPPVGLPEVTLPSATVPVPSTSTSPPAKTLPGATQPTSPTSPPPPPVLSIAPDLNMRLSTPTLPPPPPPVMTAMPPSTLPTGMGTVGLTPVASSSVTPSLTPTVSGQTLTDFDVDLHYVKQGESFASIAKEHYGDDRYGQVLQSFNQRPGFDGRVVQVPPLHWVKKQTGGIGRTAMPASTSGTTSNDEWTGVRNNNAVQSVQLSSETTFRELARTTLGSDQQWERIFNLNPSFSSNQKLPAGATIKLPADAKLTR